MAPHSDAGLDRRLLLYHRGNFCARDQCWFECSCIEQQNQCCGNNSEDLLEEVDGSCLLKSPTVRRHPLLAAMFPLMCTSFASAHPQASKNKRSDGWSGSSFNNTVSLARSETETTTGNGSFVAPRTNSKRSNASLPTIKFQLPVPTVDSIWGPLISLMDMTAEELQQEHNILNGMSVQILVNETHGRRLDSVSAVRSAAQLGVVGIIGDANSSTHEIAVESNAFRIPFCDVSTFDDSLADATQFPFSFRLKPTSADEISVVYNFILSMRWDRLSFITVSNSPQLEDTILTLSQRNNVTVQGPFLVSDSLVTCQSALKSIEATNYKIIVYYGDGESFIGCIRDAQALGMIGKGYTWIAAGTTYFDLSGNGSFTSIPEIAGEDVFAISQQGGVGQDYSNLLARWKSPTWQSFYPQISTIQTPPAWFLFYRSCLQLLMHGYDEASIFVDMSYLLIAALQLLRSNQSDQSATAVNLSEGLAGTALQSITIPGSFFFPDYETATGRVIFQNKSASRVGNFQIFYRNRTEFVQIGMANGTSIVSFNTTALATLNWINTGDLQETQSGGAGGISNVFLVLYGTLGAIAAVVLFVVIPLVWVCVVRGRKKSKKDNYQSNSNLRNTGGSKAIDMLKQIRQSQGARRLKMEEVDYLIDVFVSGNAYVPNLNEITNDNGAKIDDEMKAFIQTSVLAQGGGGAGGAQPQTLSQLNADDHEIDEELGNANTSKQSDLSMVFDRPKTQRRMPLAGEALFAKRSSRVGPGRGTLISSLNGSWGSLTGADVDASATGSPNVEITKSASVMRSSSIRQSIRNFGTAAALMSGTLDLTRVNIYLNLLSKPFPTSSVDETELFQYLMIWYYSWNIDMFAICEKTSGHPLYFTSLFLFDNTEWFRELNIPKENFAQWTLMIESNYQAHPYHNAIHAADVLHSFNYLLLSGSLEARYTALEKVAAIIAAIAHDIDHPGLNNQFMVRSSHPIAVLYSDTSVNEFHHCAHLFQLSISSSCNIFSDLTVEQYEEMRKIIIRLIMSTDMAKHFEYLTKFKAKINTAGFNRLETQENRMVVMEIALKCSDLSNPAKTREISDQWCIGIMEEFYRQGDLERERNFPVSQFMDRYNPNIAKCQIGFMDILVAPLFDVWAQFNQGDPKCFQLQKQIVKNRKRWSNMTMSQMLLSSMISEEESSGNVMQPTNDSQ